MNGRQLNSDDAACAAAKKLRCSDSIEHGGSAGKDAGGLDALDTELVNEILSYLLRISLTPWTRPCSCQGPGPHTSDWQPSSLVELLRSVVRYTLWLSRVSISFRDIAHKTSGLVGRDFLGQVLFLPRDLSNWASKLSVYFKALQKFCHAPRLGHQISALSKVPWSLTLQSAQIETTGSTHEGPRDHDIHQELCQRISTFYEPLFSLASDLLGKIRDAHLESWAPGPRDMFGPWRESWTMPSADQRRRFHLELLSKYELVLRDDGSEVNECARVAHPQLVSIPEEGTYPWIFRRTDEVPDKFLALEFGAAVRRMRQRWPRIRSEYKIQSGHGLSTQTMTDHRGKAWGCRSVTLNIGMGFQFEGVPLGEHDEQSVGWLNLKFGIVPFHWSGDMSAGFERDSNHDVDQEDDDEVGSEDGEEELDTEDEEEMEESGPEAQDHNE